MIDYYTSIGAGTGFGGLFRGAVGQTFAVLGLISMASLLGPKKHLFIVPLSWLLLLCAVFLIAKSYSRAGFFGIALGTCILLFLYSRRLVLVSVVALSLAYIYESIFSENLFVDRFFGSNTSDIEEITSGRWSAWQTAVDVLMNNFSVLLIGIGASNNNGVAALIGIWGAHNEYLDLIFKGGLILLLTYFAVLRRLFVMGLKALQLADSIFAGKLLLALVVSNAAIAVTQSHLLQAHATYTTISIVYFLYGAISGAILNRDRMDLGPRKGPLIAVRQRRLE